MVLLFLPGGDRRCGRAYCGDWHVVPIESEKQGPKFRLQGLLLPAIAAWQDEDSHIRRINVCEAAGPLHSYSPHRLDGGRGEADDLNAVVAVASQLCDSVCRFPISESRDDKQVDSFGWHEQSL